MRYALWCVSPAIVWLMPKSKALDYNALRLVALQIVVPNTACWLL